LQRAGQLSPPSPQDAARVDITIANLSILKNGRARAIRFSAMARLCQALHCQPGDLLSYQPSTAPAADDEADACRQPRPARARPQEQA